MFRVAGPAQFWLKMTNIPILHLKHKDLDSLNVSGMFAFEKFFSSHGPSLRRKTGHIKFSRKVDGGNLVKLHFLSIFNGVITSYKIINMKRCSIYCDQSFQYLSPVIDVPLLLHGSRRRNHN